MASYSDIGVIATNSDFLRRVDYAMMTAAVAVYAEAGTVTGHAARLAFAQKIFAGTYDVQRAAYAVLTNLTILTEAATSQPNFAIPDTDLQFSANSVFNALAGA